MRSLSTCQCLLLDLLNYGRTLLTGQVLLFGHSICPPLVDDACMGKRSPNN